MTEIPRIISVDDHVVEPPTMWVDRLPKKYKDVGPRVERDSAIFNFEGGVFSYEKDKQERKDYREAEKYINLSLDSLHTTNSDFSEAVLILEQYDSLILF